MGSIQSRTKIKLGKKLYHGYYVGDVVCNTGSIFIITSGDRHTLIAYTIPSLNDINLMPHLEDNDKILINNVTLVYPETALILSCNAKISWTKYVEHIAAFQDI